MLFITERKTEQKDLINGSILHMVSLFVVAYPHEVVEAQADGFESFIKTVQSQGLLVLPKDCEGHKSVVEVKRTRKGFLIKLSLELFNIGGKLVSVPQAIEDAATPDSDENPDATHGE